MNEFEVSLDFGINGTLLNSLPEQSARFVERKSQHLIQFKY